MSLSRERFDNRDFPEDIFLLIMMFVIESDFSAILSLRFVSKYFLEKTEAVSSSLFDNFCGKLKAPLMREIVPNSSGCSFFYYAKYETRRLNCGIKFLE